MRGEHVELEGEEGDERTEEPDVNAFGEEGLQIRQKASRRARDGKMILFGLPLITVMREGLEGVVFLGGIGLSEAPGGVAIGALTGLVVGALIGAPRPALLIKCQN